MSDFTFSRDFAHHRFSRTNHCIVCLDVFKKAISVPEKNAERIIRITKISIESGSTKEN